ncbi:MAG: Tetratricopeptide repeat protein 28 repeat protein 28 [Chlorobi bacterium]|nr:Tetratricopeptide repeat protein 28 repeat protein 28 [Chlorobiota bacterium]
MNSDELHTGKRNIEQELVIAGNDARRLAVLVRHLDSGDEADPGRSVELATEGLRLATILRDVPMMAAMMRHRGLAHEAVGDFGRALPDLHASHEYYSDGGPSEEGIGVAIDIAHAHAMAGEVPIAVEWYGMALEMALRAGAPRLQARALEMLAELRMSLGDYAHALDHYLRALAIHEAAGDDDAAGTALSSTGILYGRTGDNESARDCFTRSLAAFRRSGNRYYEVKALVNLGNLLLVGGQLDESLKTALTAMAIYEALGDRMNVGNVMVMIGNIHERLGRVDLAVAFQREAYTLIDSGDDNELRVSILLNIARLDIAVGSFDDALFVLDQALRIAEMLAEPRLRYEIHEMLAEAYERLHRPADALYHHKRFARLRNDIAGREKQKALAELQVRFDIEKAEREREIYRLRAEGLETEMRLKQNELAAMALNLVGKKELLDSMKGQLKQIRRGDDKGEDLSIDKLVRDIEGTQHSDDDWKIFEQQLDHLHQDFVRILSERYPMLTPAELKICSLTRINLQTKDIANLLFTSIRTVHAHKYNIRKKLGLASGVNLTTFLAGL